MAKLKAPLMSLGASGQIGKAIVYFNWKGLDVAREYVTPANPQTDPQNTQRGYLTAAVAKLHAAQAAADVVWLATEQAAYALLGSLEATPRTWFNTICKQWLDQKKAGKIPNIWRGTVITAGVLKLTVKSFQFAESSEITNVFIHYGVSKSNLSSKWEASKAGLEAGHEITGLTAGIKYYVQIRAKTPTTFLGSDSGIFYGTPTAA